MILLRRLLGDVLRRQRQRQGRTLREVSSSARVSWAICQSRTGAEGSVIRTALGDLRCLGRFRCPR